MNEIEISEQSASTLDRLEAQSVQDIYKFTEGGDERRIFAGAGIALERMDDCDSTVAEHVRGREFAWEGGSVTPANVARGLDVDIRLRGEAGDEHVRRLGVLARILTDSGQIFITSLPDADEYDVRTLEPLNSPHEILVVRLGPAGDARIPSHLTLSAGTESDAGVEAVRKLLREKKVIVDYQI